MNARPESKRRALGRWMWPRKMQLETDKRFAAISVWQDREDRWSKVCLSAKSLPIFKLLRDLPFEKLWSKSCWESEHLPSCRNGLCKAKWQRCLGTCILRRPRTLYSPKRVPKGPSVLKAGVSWTKCGTVLSFFPLQSGFSSDPGMYSGHRVVWWFSCRLKLVAVPRSRNHYYSIQVHHCFLERILQILLKNCSSTTTFLR